METTTSTQIAHISSSIGAGAGAGATTTSSSIGNSSDNNNYDQQQQQPQPQQPPPPPTKVDINDVLSAILESPQFTVGEYLNTALYDVLSERSSSKDGDGSSSNNNNDGSSNNNNTTTTTSTSTSTTTTTTTNTALIVQRLTELAVSLQLQTQISHDTIARTGMELQTILPRCYNDIQRLTTSYTQLHVDCQQLYNDCCTITNIGSGNGSSNNIDSRNIDSRNNDGENTTAGPTTTATTSTLNAANNNKDGVVSAATTTTNTEGGVVTTNSTTTTTTTTSVSDTKIALDTLRTLHTLQSNLHRTKEIIIAYNVWDTTIVAISNHIVQGNLNDTVQCLLLLQQSEYILRPMMMMKKNAQQQHAQQQRKLTLEKLEQQVTTILLQPNLQHALSILPLYTPTTTTTTTTTTNNHHHHRSDSSSSNNTKMDSLVSSTQLVVVDAAGIVPIQQCVQLYQQLNQFTILTLEYIKQRPIPIQKLWFDTYTLLSSSTTTVVVPTTIVVEPNEEILIGNAGINNEQQQQHPMVQWLPNYYQQVLHFINYERQLCELIFQNHGNNNNSSNSSNNTNNSTTTTTTAAAAVVMTGTAVTTTPTTTMNRITTIPNIMIRIVQECFRTNIISSFTSRLHTIYNPNNNNNTSIMSSSSSSSQHVVVVAFPIIATLYESTIQFLSLLYESLVSTYMELIESSSSSSSSSTVLTTSATSMLNGNEVYQLYQQICKTFVSIVLPFRDYRGMYYHTIELQYIQTTIQSNIKSIQQLTKHMKSNTDMTVEVLQETMDQLQSVASKSIFTILESALQRYELLNGGYYIEHMIQMIDKDILHVYMNEISIAVHTLSAYIVQNDSSHFMKIFEEEHVTIALQILLIMNQLIQSVQQIEYDTIIMIQRLYDRIRNHYNQEERWKNRNTTSTTMSSFQLSETLSMIEVNTILTKSVAIHDPAAMDDTNRENSTIVSDTIATLQSLTMKNTGTTTTTAAAATKVPLLTTVHETLQQKLLLSCHTFIFDVCYAIPRYYLSSIVSYKTWKADSTTASVNNEYGTLPQEYMTHIGEHMLALVQALEPFAMNSDYLQQVNQHGHILMNPKLIRRVVQPIWIDVISAMGSNKNGIQGNDTTLQLLMNGTDLIDYVLGDVITIQHDETEANQGEDTDDAAADNDNNDDNHQAVTTFCNTWLDVISTAMTGRLIERILRIPLLTNQGCEHVQADLAYIMNVLTALGIPGHPHPLLTHIVTLATLDETVLKERHEAMSSSSYDNPEATLPMRIIQAIEKRFIAMRSFG